VTPRDYGLAILYLPVPPGFDRVCGYPGSARFVSFHWSVAEDRLLYEDKAICGIGDWEGYLLYLQQPKVEQLLRGFSLGTNQDKARHALVLDRLITALYVGHRLDVRRFLDTQQRPEEHPTQERVFRGTVRPQSEFSRRLCPLDPPRPFLDKWEQLQAMRRWIAAYL